jgi:hypothetical protein
VNPAQVTVTIADPQPTYDGTAKTATITTSPTGVGINVAYSPAANPINAATYNVTVTVTDTSYVLKSDSTGYTAGSPASANGILTIKQALVTATAGSGSASYDGSMHAPSACAVSGTYTGDLTCTNSPASVGPAAGTTTITPNVSGTGLTNFAIKPVNGSYTINKASQTIDFAALSDKTAGDPHFDVTASASSGLAVSFSSHTPAVCTVTGSTVTLTNLAGTCTIRASQAGDTNYNAAADVDRSFTVNPAAAAAFTVIAPSSSMAGSFFDITVTAKDPYNNVATGYTGTIHFTNQRQHQHYPRCRYGIQSHRTTHRHGGNRL